MITVPKGANDCDVSGSGVMRRVGGEETRVGGAIFFTLNQSSRTKKVLISIGYDQLIIRNQVSVCLETLGLLVKEFLVNFVDGRGQVWNYPSSHAMATAAINKTESTCPAKSPGSISGLGRGPGRRQTGYTSTSVRTLPLLQQQSVISFNAIS